MELVTLKSMFERGVFLSALVAPAPMVNGKFNLILQESNGSVSLVTKARTVQPKEYSTYTSAVNDAQRIGFKKVTIELNN